MKLRLVVWALAVGVACGSMLVGCGKKADETATDKDGGKKPVFTLAWSEYPSWSVFGVASDMGLINGKEGELGTIEKKWGVDIKLELLNYDACMTGYQSKTYNAVCITNMDVLSPATTRKSVAILPTSTSVGADACIVVGIDDIKDLKKHKVYGLPESVSQYTFIRCLELKGEKESDYEFAQMDPDKAALAMQAKQKGVDAIMVWNPFVLQTLKTRKDAKVLFSSKDIPEEIIDMVVVGADVLEKPGGKEFACAVIETYYEFNKHLADEKQRDKLLVALGEKFSSLDGAAMAKAVEQTSFYKSPEEGLKLFTGEQFPQTMNGIVDFYVKHKFLKVDPPKVGYGSKDKAPEAQLRFDPSYIQQVKDKK